MRDPSTRELELADAAERYRRRNGWLVITVAVLAALAVAVVAASVVALLNSSRALREARRTSLNLCLSQNRANRNDVETIRGNRKESAHLLAALGFTKEQIDKYLAAAYGKGGPVERAVQARPQLDCGENAAPITRQPRR